jgi:hypothetical protein
LGNVVEIIVKDGGRGNLKGTSVVNKRKIEPEPKLWAVRPKVVTLSGGRLRFSDLRMSVLSGALTESEAVAKDTEFLINGDRFRVIFVKREPQSWEFFIRQAPIPEIRKRSKL